MKRNFWLILFPLFAVHFAKAQNDTVIFSVQGGFYEDLFRLELFNYYPQNHIRFTTNGNCPTAQSPLYDEPLILNENFYSKSDIYTIVNCPETEFYLPDSVRHCIVIRAAVFDENDSCVSRVMTNSYFIRALGCDTHGLPAISLCVDSLDLFDYERGIFVPGIHFDSLNPYFTGNYFMKGREWERLCNFEFRELDNTGVNQQVGLRTHGKQSRWRSHKGMKVYAREEYGKKRFKHKFFENLSINSFKHLTLKPFSASWNGSGCKDYITSRMAEPLDVEQLASRPTALFLNGEYWGIYYVSEKPDERFLEDHFDVDIEAVNIISDWVEADCGSIANFNALYQWMLQADLSDSEQYAYASTHIDIENFIDYYILELFSANLDWPSTNTRFWQLDDGKFRWIFFDGDACLENQNFDVFANATYEGDYVYPSSNRATLFFRRLLENEHFREQFASRFNHLVANELSYESTKPYFDFIKQTLQDEVPNQIHRFNCPSNYSTWIYYCMPVIDAFLRERPNRIIEALNDYLGIVDSQIAEFQCYPNPSSEEIHIVISAEKMMASEIAIYDLLGRKVFALPFVFVGGRNEVTIHPQLETGIYLLRMGSYTQKIVRY